MTNIKLKKPNHLLPNAIEGIEITYKNNNNSLCITSVLIEKINPNILRNIMASFMSLTMHYDIYMEVNINNDLLLSKTIMTHEIKSIQVLYKKILDFVAIKKSIQNSVYNYCLGAESM